MWLSQVKARGNKYVYLTIYNGNFDREEENIYSLGRMSKAILTLEEWEKDNSYIPEFVVELGCDTELIRKWIKKLTSTEVNSWKVDDLKIEYAKTEKIYA